MDGLGTSRSVSSNNGCGQIVRVPLLGHLELVHAVPLLNYAGSAPGTARVASDLPRTAELTCAGQDLGLARQRVGRLGHGGRRSYNTSSQERGREPDDHDGTDRQHIAGWSCRWLEKEITMEMEMEWDEAERALWGKRGGRLHADADPGKISNQHQLVCAAHADNHALA